MTVSIKKNFRLLFLLKKTKIVHFMTASQAIIQKANWLFIVGWEVNVRRQTLIWSRFKRSPIVSNENRLIKKVFKVDQAIKRKLFDQKSIPQMPPIKRISIDSICDLERVQKGSQSLPSNQTKIVWLKK